MSFRDDRLKQQNNRAETLSFTANDIVRAIKALEKAGLTVYRVEVAVDGSINMRTVSPFKRRGAAKLDKSADKEWAWSKDGAVVHKIGDTIVMEHLWQAIAKMRSEQQEQNRGKTQLQRVIEILDEQHGVSVPDGLHRTIGRRIREFKRLHG